MARKRKPKPQLLADPDINLICDALELLARHLFALSRESERDNRAIAHYQTLTGIRCQTLAKGLRPG